MAIRIITDSTSDLPKEIIDKHNITIVPLRVIFGDKEFIEGVEIDVETFYDMMSKSKDLPSTSQAIPEQFISEFEKAKEAGDEVICITLSSQLSGTYQSAAIAKEQVAYDGIHIIDSYNITMCLGLMVLKAAEMVQEGTNSEEIVQYIEDNKLKFRLYACIDSLTNLRKGGRLSSTSALVGGVLNVKPIVTVTDGKVLNIGKARGRKKAYHQVIQMVKDGGQTLDNKRICIGDALVPEYRDEFIEILKKSFTPSEIIISHIGAVIGTHAGTGSVTLMYMED